jgi:hypothetical protein
MKPGSRSDQTAAPVNIVVVQQWFEELKRLEPEVSPIRLRGTQRIAPVVRRDPFM